MRTFLGLVIGFVLGVIGTCLFLWQTGSLRTVAFAGKTWNAPAPPSAHLNPLPDTSAQAKFDRNEALPAPPPMPPAAGEAERVMPPVQPQNPATNVIADLRSRGLILPVSGANPADISDTFYQKRDGHIHEALDIMAPRGTPVVAVDEGNVVKLFHSNAGGLTVYQFDDLQTYCYYYAHLDHYANGLKEGTLLRKGEVLGYVGSTGDADPNAPHLHFAIFKLGPEKHWWQGDPIDPYPILIHGPAGSQR